MFRQRSRLRSASLNHLVGAGFERGAQGKFVLAFVTTITSLPKALV